MGCDCKKNLPEILPISQIKKESPRVTTFSFKKKLGSFPGQFVMLWVPGAGERPVAVFENERGFSVSVARVGIVSNALHHLKVGDKVGFRGPFGTYFTLPEEKGEILLVGGGYGMVPLIYLALQAKKQGFKAIILNGARTKEEILFKQVSQNKKITMLYSTDDGSLGKKGFIHQLLIDYLEGNMPTLQSASRPEGVGKKPKMLFVCGPELMEDNIAKICRREKIPFQVSLERYMKCGIGICGSCTVDPTGWRMCVEGPVVSGEQLKKIKEFGKYHRGASGMPIFFKKP